MSGKDNDWFDDVTEGVSWFGERVESILPHPGHIASAAGHAVNAGRHAVQGEPYAAMENGGDAVLDMLGMMIPGVDLAREGYDWFATRAGLDSAGSVVGELGTAASGTSGLLEAATRYRSSANQIHDAPRVRVVPPEHPPLAPQVVATPGATDIDYIDAGYHPPQDGGPPTPMEPPPAPLDSAADEAAPGANMCLPNVCR